MTPGKNVRVDEKKLKLERDAHNGSCEPAQ